MIFTPISHLRGMLQHRASIPNNPYHDQHILEFTGYMEETVEIRQQYYDGILLKQNEIIDALVQRVEKLEQSVPTKRNPFEVDIVATKESLRKLKETILGIFR